MRKRRFAQRFVDPLRGGARDAQLTGQLTDRRQPITRVKPAGDKLCLGLLLYLRGKCETAATIE